MSKSYKYFCKANNDLCDIMEEAKKELTREELYEFLSGIIGTVKDFANDNEMEVDGYED